MSRNGLPAPPAHLSREGRSIWRRVTRGWLLDEANLVVLGQALESLSRLREAQDAIRRDGLILEDPSGRRRAHPACQIEKESRLALLRAWRQIGLDVDPPGPIGRPGGR